MNVKYIKGALAILSSAAAPFGAYAMSEVSLRAAVVLAIVAGLAAAHNWLDSAFSGQDPTVPGVAGLVAAPVADPVAMLIVNKRASLLHPSDSGADLVHLALPHTEADADSQHPSSTPAAPPDPTDVKEGSV